MSLLQSVQSKGATRTLLALVMLTALASPGLQAQPAQQAGTDAKPPAPKAQGDVHTTAPVIVNGKADPLARSDRKLARLKKSLPGTQAKAPSSALGRYAAAHDDPNAATGQQREMMERANGPAAGNGPDSGLAPH
jgi:hypothetical protein